MSKGGTTTSTSSIDPQIKEAFLANFQQAQGVAGALPTQQFAGYNPMYQAGEEALVNTALAGPGISGTDLAAQMAAYGGVYQPGQITAQQTNLSMGQGPGSIGSYMNPYTNEVVNNTSQDIARQAAILRTGAGGSSGMASNMGAFGSDRQGVVDSTINRDALQQTGNTAGQLRYQGYNDASTNFLNQFNQGNANNLSAAGMAGQMGGALNSAGLQGFGQLGQMAQTGIDLQRGNQENWYRPQTMRLGAGNQIQQQNQSVLDAINGVRSAPTSYLSAAANPFLSNNSNETASSPSTLSRLGAGGSALGGLLDTINGYKAPATNVGSYNWGGGL